MTRRRIHRTALTLMIGSFSIIGVGCASQTPDAPTTQPVLASAGTGATTDTGADPRVTCKCGTWAGSKGAPTQCRKVLEERRRQRELAHANE